MAFCRSTSVTPSRTHISMLIRNFSDALTKIGAAPVYSTSSAAMFHGIGTVTGAPSKKTSMLSHESFSVPTRMSCSTQTFLPMTLDMM